MRRLVLAVAAGLVALAGYGAFRIWETGQRDDRGPAEAIVVLGAAQERGRPSRLLRARLDHAVELYRGGAAPYLVLTGGRSPEDVITEAEAARRYVTAAGVPEDALLWEDRGHDTVSSLRNVAPVLRERGIGDVIFVSDRAHMFRVLHIARDLGFQARGSPARTVRDDDPLSATGAVLYELVGLAQYVVTGS